MSERAGVMRNELIGALKELDERNVLINQQTLRASRVLLDFLRQQLSGARLCDEHAAALLDEALGDCADTFRQNALEGFERYAVTKDRMIFTSSEHELARSVAIVAELLDKSDEAALRAVARAREVSDKELEERLNTPKDGSYFATRRMRALLWYRKNRDAVATNERTARRARDEATPGYIDVLSAYLAHNRDRLSASEIANACRDHTPTAIVSELNNINTRRGSDTLRSGIAKVSLDPGQGVVAKRSTARRTRSDDTQRRNEDISTVSRRAGVRMQLTITRQTIIMLALSIVAIASTTFASYHAFVKSDTPTYQSPVPLQRVSGDGEQTFPDAKVRFHLVGDAISGTRLETTFQPAQARQDFSYLQGTLEVGTNPQQPCTEAQVAWSITADGAKVGEGYLSTTTRVSQPTTQRVPKDTGAIVLTAIIQAQTPCQHLSLFWHEPSLRTEPR